MREPDAHLSIAAGYRTGPSESVFALYYVYRVTAQRIAADSRHPIRSEWHDKCTMSAPVRIVRRSRLGDRVRG